MSIAGSEDMVNLINRDDCYTMGWGALCDDTPRFPEIMHELRYSLLEQQYCQLYYQGKFNANHMLCCGDLQNVKGYGYGDSGAPVICTIGANRNIRVIIGLLSIFPEVCGQGPDVLVKLSLYTRWITFYSDSPEIEPPVNPFIPSVFFTGPDPIRRKRKTFGT